MLIAVVFVAVAAVAVRNGPPSPEDDLRRVRDFMESAATGRFEQTERVQNGRGPDEPGSTSVDLTRFEGTFALPDQLHVLEDNGDYFFEAVSVPAGSYSRHADTRAGLAVKRWSYEPPVEPSRVEGGEAPDLAGDEGSALFAAGVFGVFGERFDLVEMLGRLTGDVRRVSPGVLEATLPMRRFLPEKMVEDIEADVELAKKQAGGDPGGEVPDVLAGTVTIRLVHAADGRLDELMLTIENGDGGDRSVNESRMRFSAWGERLSIAVPARSEVDPTPGVDEEDLAAFAAFPVVGPEEPPEGMILEDASVIEEDVQSRTCTSIDLFYGDSTAEDRAVGRSPLSYLSVRAFSVGCPWRDGGSPAVLVGDPRQVQVGPYPGELHRVRYPGGDPDEVLFRVRMTVEDVLVFGETNLGEHQLLTTMASVAPLDMAAQPVRRSEPPPGS